MAILLAVIAIVICVFIAVFEVVTRVGSVLGTTASVVLSRILGVVLTACNLSSTVCARSCGMIRPVGPAILTEPTRASPNSLFRRDRLSGTT